MNFDGGLAVIRNDVDEIMGAKTAKVQNVYDPFEVEAKAAIQAMDFAYDLGFRNIIVEGDFLHTIQCLRRKSLNISSIRHLVDEGLEKAKMIQTCLFQNIL
ncbi:hypothetical protein PTKIN_Ptkin09bG0178000 [Pterospermum kingtungense]